MAFTLPSEPELLIGLALNRARRDFGERDRTVLNLLRPHLIRAYRNVLERELLTERLAALARGFEFAGQGVVVLDRTGGVDFLSKEAGRLISGIGGGRHSELPPVVLEWLRRQRAAVGTRGPEPLVLESADVGPVVLRYVGPRRAGEPDALLIEPAERGLAAESLRSLGLTEREAEVLCLLARGRSNQDIAAELEISRRTVEKHLEHVFGKLGVATRNAAAATAWAGIGIARLRAGDRSLPATA